EAPRRALGQSQLPARSQLEHRFDRLQRAVVQGLSQGLDGRGGAMNYLALLLLLVACHPQQEVPAAPPPLRPPAEAKSDSKASKDCEPTDPQAEKKPLTFDERSIPEGQRLA